MLVRSYIDKLMGTGGCQAFGDVPVSAVVLLGHQLFGVVEPVVVVGVVCCVEPR